MASKEARLKELDTLMEVPEERRADWRNAGYGFLSENGDFAGAGGEAEVRGDAGQVARVERQAERRRGGARVGLGVEGGGIGGRAAAHAAAPAGKWQATRRPPRNSRNGGGTARHRSCPIGQRPWKRQATGSGSAGPVGVVQHRGETGGETAPGLVQAPGDRPDERNGASLHPRRGGRRAGNPAASGP